MNNILTKISGPLLVGSILVLGALALPAHADATDGPLVIFRASSGVLPMQVADNGGGKEGGGGASKSGFPTLRFAYSGGWVFECRTDWTPEMLEADEQFLVTRWTGSKTAPAGTFPELGYQTNSAMPFTSSFVAIYFDAGTTAQVYKANNQGDPRPESRIGGKPNPCADGTAEIVARGPDTDLTTFIRREIISLDYVYK